jgi:hypothetical protein
MREEASVSVPDWSSDFRRSLNDQNRVSLNFCSAVDYQEVQEA